MNILLTEATSPAGSRLLKEFAQTHKVVAVTSSATPQENSENITWVTADLFAPEDVERIMQGIDQAVFLLSDAPSNARLTQANAQDMAALIADNFARAAQKAGVHNIVFVEKTPNAKHQECLDILSSRGIPVTTRSLDLAEQPRGGVVKKKRKTVRSIQRITVPSRWTAQTTADYYLRWLELTGLGMVKTTVSAERAEIGLRFFIKEPLLSLEHDAKQSHRDYFVYRITGGKLARTRPGSRARLVFSKILREDQVFVGIHEFEPALPWALYVLTQAQVHLVTMKLFGLKTKASGGF